MLQSSTKFKNKPNLNGADIFYHVDIPNQVCLEWDDVASYSKQIYGLSSGVTVSGLAGPIYPTKFVSNGMMLQVIPNKFTLLHNFLEKSCKLSLNLEIDRVVMRLKKQCPSIAKMVRAAKGNQRIALLKNSLKVNIT